MTLLLANDAPSSMLVLWGVGLFGLAFLLVLVELFIPTGGILGLVAAGSAIGSVTAFFVYDTTFGTVALIIYLVLIPLLLWFFFKVWVNSPIARQFVLGATADGDAALQTSGEAGDDRGPDEDGHYHSTMARAARTRDLRSLIGAEGETVTQLRPIGVVKIDGRRIDAMAENGLIDSGVPVVVTDAYDNQLKVRPA